MKHFIAGALLLLNLASCTHYDFVPGPGTNGMPIGMAEARCRLFADSNGQINGFVAASGSPKFVAGAVAGSAIGAGLAQAVHQNHLFNDCMMANGWVPGGPPVAGAAPTQIAAVSLAAPAPPVEAAPVAPPTLVAYTYRQPAYDEAVNCIFQGAAGRSILFLAESVCRGQGGIPARL
jgi:hypothetical protein